MSAEYDSILARARKILALAEDPGATPGEKAAAHAALNRLLTAHGISLESLRDETRTTRWFKFANRHERRLLFQVHFLITHQPGQHYVQRRGRKTTPKTIGFDLTDAEEIDLRAGFTHYRKAWAEHLDIQFSAFIQAHQIFGPSQDEPRPPSPADMDRLLRIMRAAREVSGPSWQRPAAALDTQTLTLPPAS